MKKLFFFCLVSLAVALASCDDHWKVYDTSEFTIEFPGIAHDTVTMEGDYAGVRSYFEPVKGSLDSNVYYSVSMYTLPDSASELGDDLKGFFQSDVKVYAYYIGGILADSGTAVKSGTTPGWEFKVFLAGNSGVATIRKFAYGKHLYTLLVVTENNKLDNTAIRRFMDSFKLKPAGSSKQSAADSLHK